MASSRRVRGPWAVKGFGLAALIAAVVLLASGPSWAKKSGRGTATSVELIALGGYQFGGSVEFPGGGASFDSGPTARLKLLAKGMGCSPEGEDSLVVGSPIGLRGPRPAFSFAKGYGEQGPGVDQKRF